MIGSVNLTIAITTTARAQALALIQQAHAPLVIRARCPNLHQRLVIQVPISLSSRKILRAKQKVSVP